MSCHVLLAIPDEQLANEAVALAAESIELEPLGVAPDADAVRSALLRRQVDVIVLDEALAVAVGGELALEIATGFPEVGVVLLAGEETPEALRTALRIGARELLTRPLSLDALEAQIGAAASPHAGDGARGTRSGPAMRSGGRLIAVAGAKGGVGTTTVAIYLALAALDPASGLTVCLADFDLQTGDLGSYLETSARRSVLDLAGVSDEITPRQLEETLLEHRSGVHVLMAPERGELAEEVDAAGARRVLGALKGRFDVVVVDLGSVVSEPGAAAAEIAGEALVVVTPDVPALRGANRLIGLWRRLAVRESHELTVVLNRASRTAEVQPDLADQVVEGGLARARIPDNFRALQGPVNSGKPETLGDRRLQDAYLDLAEEVLATPAMARASPASALRGLRARFGDDKGQVTAEAAGLAALVCVVALALWQLVLGGYTFVLAGHAAREGARALAVGEPVREAVRADVKGPWRDGLELDRDDERVEVTLRVPVVLPGLEGPLRVASAAGSPAENEPIAQRGAAIGVAEVAR
jgi:pilus assembly protein CpaE